MNTITRITYPTPQAYLDATENWLLERELDNNLILGLCYAFADKNAPVADAHFLNVFRDGVIEATSIKTWHKIIITGYTENADAVRMILEYYLAQQVTLNGVFGTCFHAETFARLSGKKITQTIGMLVHELQTVSTVTLPEGRLEMATAADLGLLVQWSMNFEVDVQSYPLKTREELTPYVLRRINDGHFFKWMVADEPVCMAAIVRKTKNTGIVGLVYTPDQLRGRGYATGCVHALSTYMLANGCCSCGLFTDAGNPVSNGIYYKIGYRPGMVYTDVTFDGAM